MDTPSRYYLEVRYFSSVGNGHLGLNRYLGTLSERYLPKELKYEGS